MYEEALAEYQKLQNKGVIGRVHPRIAYVYALTGKRREAKEVLAELEEQSEKRPDSPVTMAVIHVGLGEKELAIALLEKNFDEGRADSMNFLGLHPTWDSLRSEPRFRDLLRRMGLPR